MRSSVAGAGQRLLCGIGCVLSSIMVGYMLTAGARLAIGSAAFAQFPLGPMPNTEIHRPCYIHIADDVGGNRPYSTCAGDSG